ncbi:MAG TPA: metalloregulator ArsR/SmtB family transcription factor [Thermoanaerobaculia bacterium]|nr:metalloregulator ArsR/SmtB family transcription factor [Thermoanaerobaculia bacterium]
MGPLARLVKTHKAIAHPVRLRILAMLRGGPLCVCQMTMIVNLAPSTVSEHLSELRRAGLVSERRDGRWVEYRLNGAAACRSLLDSLWQALDDDVEARADAIVANELRVPADERITRPKLAAAVRRARRIRTSPGASR